MSNQILYALSPHGHIARYSLHNIPNNFILWRKSMKKKLLCCVNMYPCNSVHIALAASPIFILPLPVKSVWRYDSKTVVVRAVIVKIIVTLSAKMRTWQLTPLLQTRFLTVSLVRKIMLDPCLCGKKSITDAVFLEMYTHNNNTAESAMTVCLAV